MKTQLLLVSKQVGQFATQHSTTILTITATVGVCTTAIMASNSTLKAQRVIEELEYTSEEKPTRMQKFKVAFPKYIPPAIMAAATITCILGAHKIHLQREAALAAAYTLMDSRYKEYREKVISELGEKKERKIQDDMAQKKVNTTYDPENGLNLIRTRFGNVLFMDSFTGRYFTSSYEHIEKAQIHITKMAQLNHSASLNDLFDFLEIPTTKHCDLIGWNIFTISDDSLHPVIPLITNRTCKTPTPEQLPCTVLDYEFEPLIDYDKCYP